MNTPCSGDHKMFHFSLTIHGYHYYVLSLFDLCPEENRWDLQKYKFTVSPKIIFFRGGNVMESINF